MIAQTIENQRELLHMIISTSGLSKSEQQLWYGFIPALEAIGAVASLISLVTEAPSALPELTDNLRKKARAIMTGDISAFKTIINEEVALVSQPW